MVTIKLGGTQGQCFISFQKEKKYAIFNSFLQVKRKKQSTERKYRLKVIATMKFLK